MNRVKIVQSVSSILRKGNLEKLTNLHQELKNIESFCHEYDFFPGVKANGFRSFVKIVDSFFESLDNKKDDINLFGQLEDMIGGLERQSEIMREAREKGNYSDVISMTLHDKTILKSILSFSPELIEPFFGQNEMFFLDPVCQMMYKKIFDLPVISVLSMEEKEMLFSNSHDSYKVIRDFKVRGWNSHNGIGGSKKEREISIKFAMMLLKEAGMTSKSGSKTSRNKEVVLPLLSEWKIENPGYIMEKEPQRYPVRILDNRDNNSENPLKGLYISQVDGRGGPKNKDDSLIIHYHGGGFCHMNPWEHESYLSMWSKKLGVPLLCPNYKKAPRSKFPAGLQDCLDTYLFVTSGRSEVKELLGFHPKKILITGDSAGGNLAVGVTFCLNEIRKNSSRSSRPIKMPRALSLQYPYSAPTMIMTPSEALLPLTPLISPRALESMILAYTPTGLFLPREDWYDRPEDIETWSRIVSASCREPLINNLCYNHFEDLSDVPFHVNICDFDPLLDQGLMMANKWPYAKVYVVSDIHGWCLLGQYATHNDKIDTILSRMAESLEIEFKL